MPFIVTLATQMTVPSGLSAAAAQRSRCQRFGRIVRAMSVASHVAGIVVLVATAIMLFVMTRTSHGRYLYAIGGNPEAASASVNVKRQVFVNYIIMGSDVLPAGILYAGRTNSGSSAAGVNSSLRRSSAAYRWH